MSKLNTPFEVYKLLPKSNCGQCRIPTCLAFSAAVIKDQKRLADCPHLDRDTIARFAGKIDAPASLEGALEKSLSRLKEKTQTADILSRAERLGAARSGDRLTIKCLGKDFAIDSQGNLASQCHTHTWFAVLLLNYVLHARGTDATGRWTPLRELGSGARWASLFEQRCEKPLKQIADTHVELFENLITLFSGMSSANNFSADISVLLYPFPKVPVLICYWKREEDIDSKLHVFFDSTAEDNLDIESLFSLGVGIVGMIEKIMVKHR